VSLFEPRATLGQRLFLIKPKNTYKYTTIHWQNHTTTIQKQTRRNTHRRRPDTPTALGDESLPGLLPVERTQMPVGRTTERPSDVPLGDGDSDRDVAHSRSDWLSSRSSTLRSKTVSTHPVTLAPSQTKAGSFVTKPVTGKNISNLAIRHSYLHILTHRCFIIILLQRIPT